ncbi:Uncharacterised protein [Klebsiella oxytoca]|nr:Uncharacterised protein [Klebsiella oxytoca]
MLRANGREIQTGGEGVGLLNLPLIGLHHRRFHTEVDAHAAVLKRRPVFAGFDPMSRGLHANQANGGVVDKVSEHADSIGAAANAGDNRIRQASFFLQDLRFSLFANHALEFTHDGRERMRSSGGAKHVVGFFIAA